MGADPQTTIKTKTEFAGIGLHSGEACRISVCPGAVDSGIIFRRCDFDLNGSDSRLSNLIHASPAFVVGSDHGTTLANSHGASVSTVEHLMAAFAIMSVDNAIVDVYGPEIPIFDGSAEHLVAGLMAAGVKTQDAKRGEILIGETVRVEDGGRVIEISPAVKCTIDISIDFGDCLIGRQSLLLDLDNPADRDRLAKSRTFCRLYEVDALRQAGLARGGSLDNSLVVDGQELMNGQPLRDPHEFALHKALDLLGDLYLLGQPIRGAIRAVKPGHALNAQAALAVARSVETDEAAEAEPLAATA